MRHGGMVGGMRSPVGGVEPFPFLSSCAFVYDGHDVDGDGSYNAGYTTGDKVATWANLGTAGASSNLTAKTGTTYRPTICNECANGIGAVSWDGVADYMAISSSTTSAAFLSNSADFEVFVVARLDQHRSTRYIVSSTNTSTRKGWSLHQGPSGNREGLGAFITSGTAANINFTSTIDTTIGGFEVLNVHAAGVAANSYKVSRDVSSYDQGTISGTLHTGDATENMGVGDYSAATTSTSADMEVALIALCEGEMTAGDRATFVSWARGRYGADWHALDASTSIVALGDSITATTAGRADVGWTHQLDIDTGPTVSVGNNATGGWLLSSCQTEWTNSIDNDGADILLMWCGGNDIRAGTAAATVFTAWEAIVDDALAQGMTVVGMTFPPYGTYSGWNAAQQTELDAINASILAKTGAGYIPLDMYTPLEDDVTADRLEVDYDSGDGLHPGSAGQPVISALVQAALSL